MYDELQDNQNVEYTSNGRPILKVPMDQKEKIMLGSSIIILITQWIIVLIRLPGLPDEIPSTHWKDDHQIQSYSSKYTLLICPIASLLSTSIFHFITRYPYKFNYAGNVITIQTAPKIYAAGKIFVRYLNIIINTLFLIVLLFTLNAVDSAQTLSSGFVLVIILFPIIGIASGLCIFLRYINRVTSEQR